MEATTKFLAITLMFLLSFIGDLRYTGACDLDLIIQKTRVPSPPDELPNYQALIYNQCMYEASKFAVIAYCLDDEGQDIQPSNALTRHVRYKRTASVDGIVKGGQTLNITYEVLGDCIIDIKKVSEGCCVAA